MEDQKINTNKVIAELVAKRDQECDININHNIYTDLAGDILKGVQENFDSYRDYLLDYSRLVFTDSNRLNSFRSLLFKLTNSYKKMLVTFEYIIDIDECKKRDVASGVQKLEIGKVSIQKVQEFIYNDLVGLPEPVYTNVDERLADKYREIANFIELCVEFPDISIAESTDILATKKKKDIYPKPLSPVYVVSWNLKSVFKDLRLILDGEDPHDLSSIYQILKVLEGRADRYQDKYYLQHIVNS